MDTEMSLYNFEGEDYREKQKVTFLRTTSLSSVQCSLYTWMSRKGCVKEGGNH